MTTTTIDAGELVTSYLAMLARVTGLAVGDGRAPGSDQDAPTKAYLVAAVIGSTGSTGDGGNMASIRTVTVQVTGVGWTRAQAAMALEWAHHATVAQGPNGWAEPVPLPAGRVIIREHLADGGVLAEGELFNAVGQYRLTASL